MAKQWERATRVNMVEAPGIEPGSGSSSFVRLRAYLAFCIARIAPTSGLAP